MHILSYCSLQQYYGTSFLVCVRSYSPLNLLVNTFPAALLICYAPDVWSCMKCLPSTVCACDVLIGPDYTLEPLLGEVAAMVLLMWV